MIKEYWHNRENARCMSWYHFGFHKKKDKKHRKKKWCLQSLCNNALFSWTLRYRLTDIIQRNNYGAHKMRLLTLCICWGKNKEALMQSCFSHKSCKFDSANIKNPWTWVSDVGFKESFIALSHLDLTDDL